MAMPTRILFRVLSSLRESAGSLAVQSVVYAVRQWVFDPGRTADAEPTHCRYSYTVDFVPP